MKVALCFLISYNHIINKEEIWIKWINEISNIINVYIHYTDYSKIKSKWIKKYIIPKNYIQKTNYTHVVPAYFSLLKYALKDKNNKWFCFLTESCCPIISPYEFKEKFYKLSNYSIIKCSKISWNPLFVNRANLKYIDKELHLTNNPWFTLTRESANKCIIYSFENYKFFKLICDGIIANESIFSIILHNEKNIINKETFIIDWSRMTSPTSPYTFTNKNIENDLLFIEKKKKEKYIMFIRKISVDFPNDKLNEIIWKNDSYYKYFNFNIQNILVSIFIINILYLFFLYF